MKYFFYCKIEFKNGKTGYGNFEIDDIAKIKGIDDIRKAQRMILTSMEKENKIKIEKMTVVNWKSF